MIKVQNICKTLGTTLAVNDVSFDVTAGEILGLLGPNGAGKTTTLNMLVGILQPDGGTVRINEGNPCDAGTRHYLGIAPQGLSLYEELTAQENLTFLGQLYGLSAGHLRDRVHEMLEFAALTDRRKHPVRTYSGGMKRRLNMAAALIHDPEVVVFDEPTVGVDPQSRNHIFDRIEELKKNGRTIVYTTHFMEEAQRLCDRVAVMDHGRILAMDTLGGLLTTYGGAAIVKGELEPDCQLAACPGVEADRSFRFSTNEPVREVVRLSESGVAFKALQINQPDLEAVFLSLTGRSLRDD